MRITNFTFFTAIIAIFALAIPQNTYSQVYQFENPGFEQWDGGSNDEPTGWNSYPSGNCTMLVGCGTAKTKRHAIVIIAEKVTSVQELAKIITARTPFQARASILGHIQRGGCPTPRDRVLASCMGVKAVEELVKGNGGVCVCEINNSLKAIPFEEALKMKKDQVSEKMKQFKELW